MAAPRGERGRRSRRRGRREKSLAGTHLVRRVDTGVLVWRRNHPVTGKRIHRSTGTTVLEFALKRAAEFELDFQRLQAGIKTFKAWRLDLAVLAEEWLAAQERERTCSPPVLQAKRFRIARALEVLSLATPADLTEVARIHDRLLALPGKTKAHLREAWQEPLKQFSRWLAENGRYLERDPLAAWKSIPKEGRGKRNRRAFNPEEVARALVAADALDVIHRREHPTRIVFVLLLVAAPRASALLSRDVADFERESGRIVFGEDAPRKRKGAGSLDPRTREDLLAYLGERSEGPLVLSPKGKRLGVERLLDYWREAFGLGLVRDLWPDDEPWDVNLGHEVNQALRTGRAQGQAGNPKRVKRSTKVARRARAALVLELASELREGWTRRMKGVDVHAFRKTHRTWALALGVPEVLIDKQLGHAPRPGGDSMDLLRVVSGSRTGRKHYLDMRSRLLEARQSAIKVRELLDEALAGLPDEGGGQPSVEAG